LLRTANIFSYFLRYARLLSFIVDFFDAMKAFFEDELIFA